MTISELFIVLIIITLQLKFCRLQEDLPHLIQQASSTYEDRERRLTTVVGRLYDRECIELVWQRLA